jgi:hypothetical protein
MRLFLKLCAIAFLVCAPVTILHAQGSDNLNFEVINKTTGLPEVWFIPSNTGFPAQLDSVTKQNGQYSLSIEKGQTAGSFGVATYSVKSTFEGKKLVLTGYIKTENVANGYAGLWMRVDGDNGTLSFDNMGSRGITGTTGWTKYTIELAHHEEDAHTIYLGGLLTGSGKMWMDNLELTIDGQLVAMAKPKTVVLSKAKTDTAFKAGSGITTISLDKPTIGYLTNLGMLWGFLKYHHPAIAKGDYNWDAELFRVLPKLLVAKSHAAANKVLEEWVDGLGKPAACADCKEIIKDSNTKLLPDYGNLLKPGNFSPAFIKKLTWIKNNRNQGKHYYIAMANRVRNPEFKNEEVYHNMVSPDAGYRLLALYRYWNMIQYFFPYKHLIGEDWNKVLPEFIPVFAQAKDSTAYAVACLRLIVRIHDTHANVWGNNKTLSNYFGKYHAPIEARFVEDKLVITGYYTALVTIRDKLHKGDIITRIDQVPVADLIKKWLPETPASNYETQLRDMPNKLLRGHTPSLELEIERYGKKSTVTVDRYEANKLDYSINNDLFSTDSSYQLLNDRIGYVYPGKYKNSQLPAIRELFKNTKGMVIDLRCYPSEFMPFTFGEYIKPDSSPFVKFTRGSATTPGLFVLDAPLSNGSSTGNYYKGKIVVIVDASTQSQAEYTTMAFQSSPNVTVIGSTTAAADGNVSAIYLPGNIYTMISGIGVYYPDGTETQRKGVKIDQVLKPTIQGIKEGRDELLEKAIEIIERGSTQPAKKGF